jgi:hypothetical protein
MSALTQSPEIETFLDKISGITDSVGEGDPRAKAIIRKILSDLFDTIDHFDVSADEFWTALNFISAGAPELGLWAAGLGFEHFLDIRMGPLAFPTAPHAQLKARSMLRVRLWWKAALGSTTAAIRAKP